jgi:DNA polymerase-3 subunit alpha
MDGFGTRSQLMAVLDKAIEGAQKSQRDAESGQHGLFGVFADESGKPPSADKLPEIPDWDEHQRLAAEKEVLGFFITGHPLEKYKDKIADFRALDTEAISNMKQGTGKDEIYTAGMITNIRVQKSKKGDLYANGVLEDMAGAVDIIVFPEAYKRLTEKVKLEVPVLIKASVRVEEGANPKLAIGDIIPLETAKPKLPRAIRIRVPAAEANEAQVDALQAICRERKGEAKVMFDVEREGDFMVVMEPDGYNVLPDRAFIAQVEDLLGKGAVRVVE